MNETLALRLLNALPAGAYEVTALLGLLRIEESRDVPTAAVTCERRPVLKLNPDFLGEHCASDEHLFMLVMHELHHVLLGHTRLFPRATPLHNVAFDAVINALLCTRFPQPRTRRSFSATTAGRAARCGSWRRRAAARSRTRGCSCCTRLSTRPRAT
ncbi:MAG: hypothetical protein IPF66_19690 [Holophagales bacterium]|nr:hypothetical protein [Holophagales bacterium]